jgi:RNA polymerase sigma-70 factor (ECF subfamily)
VNVRLLFGNETALPSFEWVRRAFAFAVNLLGGEKVEPSLESLDDETLAKRMSEGDDRAFETLYERYFQKVYMFVVRRTGHQQTAEDLVSDVFMKAFTHRRSFVWKTSFSAWIYRIATNRITDYYRSKKPTEELDETHEQHPAPASVPGEVDVQLLGRELESVIEKLAERERIVLTMKFYAECTNEEIAKALNVTANNAGVILHRALAKCAKLASEKLKQMV